MPSTYRPAFVKPAPPLKGLDAMVHGLSGRLGSVGRGVAGLLEMAGQVDALDAEARGLKEGDLDKRLAASAELARRKRRLVDDDLVQALAWVREAARRTLGLHPYPVQIAGALALHRGDLAEMATGEGKTLTAAMAAAILGWERGCLHVITVNDYLAERDADRMGVLLRRCHLKCGVVLGPMDREERRKAYACDVVYATSKEVLADFLRDRLAAGTVQEPTRRLARSILNPRLNRLRAPVLRGLHAAVVDEADSVLIDEAVTPLLISAARPQPLLEEACLAADKLVADWAEGDHFTVNARYREVRLTPRAERDLDTAAEHLPALWRSPGRREEVINRALQARVFYHRGEQYLIEDGKIVIVDEFTGRPMPQRSWREGMHQAVEAKEGLELSDPAETSARMSFQRFFQLYRHLSGMTGTARESGPELWSIYKLRVVVIPTNRPCIREVYPARFFPDEEAKFTAVADEVEEMRARGRPVLIGTRHVRRSEALSEILTARGIPHEVLNATRLKEEAVIVGGAGVPGRITIATNMAGRGTDIKLGEGVAKAGGLHVIATEPHGAARIDRQLFGRAARQGDPGSCRMCASAGDELFKRFLPAGRRKILDKAIAAGLPAANALGRREAAAAQARAQNQARKQRRAVQRADTWLEEALAFGGEG